MLKKPKLNVPKPDKKLPKQDKNLHSRRRAYRRIKIKYKHLYTLTMKFDGKFWRSV